MNNKHIGSSFDDFLEEDGTLTEALLTAKSRTALSTPDDNANVVSIVPSLNAKDACEAKNM